MTASIRAENVSKWFGLGTTRTWAVHDASLHARAGEMLYVVGPSGSGKTTLLSIISGILRPSGGRVTVGDVDIWSLDEDSRAHFRLDKVGFVFQDYHLFPHLSSVENVAVPLILKRLRWNEAIEEARRCLEVVGLEARADVVPAKLSGGEQQRVAIARAVVGHPEILILDEPTAALDGATGRRIIRFIRDELLDERRCIIVVTHDERIFDLADRVARMEDGHFVLGTSDA